MTSEPPAKRKCLGVDCPEDAGTLQCPTCLKVDIKDSFFCSQDCFKRSWNTHKALHKSKNTGLFNPFPTYPFTGKIRPVYPLSPRREVPSSIQKPDYADDGMPKSERTYKARNQIMVLDETGIAAMRKVAKIGREVLDIAAAAAVPGVTTDYIDELVHKACMERDAYPSPLNYHNFPKSYCSSINEVICHGIPDQRILLDGDILNIDISVYHGGYHSDLNETYYIGEKAKQDPDTVRVVEASRESLNKAIEIVKPGTLFREFGNVIEKYATSQKCSVIKTYCGHGINTNFHPPPNIPHYAKNKQPGACKEGICFTIEPMIALGTHRDKTWPDDWTSVTADGKKTAQFEHTLLVTKDGVEVLTARLPNSPGGPVPMPTVETANGDANGTTTQ